MRHTTTADLFQHSLQTTDRWLRDTTAELGWTDMRKGYTAVRATLQALREHVPMDECAQFSAQLPLVLRGVFWEGWNPSCAKVEHSQFLSQIHAAFRHDSETDPERVARAVLKTLAKEISAGEMDDVRGILPEEIRRLMPAPGSQSASNGSKPRVEPVSLQREGVGAVRWGA